jgi:hypothetical protein
MFADATLPACCGGRAAIPETAAGSTEGSAGRELPSTIPCPICNYAATETMAIDARH